ncbi:MAG: SusC/RagA family TonB-linked outer membrane protein, partial [Chitinophagaceae bacterium]
MKIISILILVVLALPVKSQDTKDSPKTFSGTVSDQNKNPLGGVTLGIQETNTVVTTDASGKFTIKALTKDVLVVKKENYLTMQIVLDALANLNIRMKAAITDAGEEDDVVIPFGVRKKREINSSMSFFKTADLPQLLLSNLYNAMQGRIPGLYIQQTDNRPGNDNANIFVRGRSSYGSAGARVLVDGVPRDFQDMDVNEIENITVLKDAAAQAWYGLRAGQGVVLITTRKGSALRSSINLDIQGGVQMAQKTIQPLNSFDYATLYNEARVNDKAAPIFNDAALAAYQDGSSPFLFPNNNYIDRFLNKSSNIQRYVLSADGGNSSLRYFVLLSYFNQGGLFADSKSTDFNSNNGFKRFNFRGNIDFDVNKNLTVSLYSGGRAENRLDPGDNTGTLLSTLNNTPPNAFPILNQNGTYGGTTDYRNNPLGMIRDRGYISAVDRVLLASLNVKQKLDFITSGLSANIYYSYDVSGTYTSGLNRDYEVYDLSGAAPVLFRTKTPLGYRSSSFTNNNRRNEIWAGFDYDRSFGSHNVKASLRGQRNVNVSPERLDFRGQGVSGRVDYSFRDKYYLGFVGSYSGSENFPPGKRYGFFPAVSAGYVITDKGFTPEGNFLSYLKIRGSAGQSGNSEIGGNRFPFESFYARNTGSGGYTFGTGFSNTPSANESNLGNPDITWETYKSVDLGLELKLFRNALSLSADVYKAKRSGILTEAVIPSILGQSLGTVNDGV